MKTARSLLVLPALLLSSAPAQDPLIGSGPPHAPYSLEERMRVEEAARWAAQSREVQFVEQMNQFARLWNRMAQDYNRKHAFNVKTAKELSEVFRKLERTGDWPRGN
jgi:hypothetical protein